MKKVISLISIMFLCLFVSGCGSVNLDLEKVSKTVDNLLKEEFDMLMVAEKIEGEDSYFKNLYDVYDYDLKNLNINKENIEKMTFRVDSDSKPAYIIIKPKEGKKDTVKKEVDKYISSFDNLDSKTESEYEGFLIYVFSSKGEEILTKIKEAKSPVFGMLANVDNEYLESLINISPDLLDEFIVKNSIMTQSSGYYILKPKSGKKEEVKKLMDKYMKSLETQWQTYLPDQYELVKNRLEEEYGNYLIYIISSDNDLVLKTIKDCKK